MEQKAEQDVQSQALYREDAIRRILRVIDEAGGTVTSVDLQNAALLGILDSDTLWHAERDGTFVKYDLQKMRELAARVTRDCRLTPTTGEDRVNLLFRLTSRDLPPDLVRKWQYGPDRVSFENQRPRTSLALATRRSDREDSTRMNDLSILEDPQETDELPFNETKRLCRSRAAWVVLQDVDASRPDRNNPDHKYSARSMRPTALQDICGRFQLRYCTP